MRASLPPCQVEVAGQQVELRPERALWWPAQRALFIADLHLGKAAAYRSLGQPVPGGTTDQNLQRLSALVETTGARELYLLGDFLHAASSRTPSLLSAVARWRDRHAELSCTLVRGNHDDRAGDPPAELQIAIVDEPHLVGPFAACHHPQSHPTHFVLAGHLHPACTLYGPGRDHLRMPCFVREADHMILPAFGEFTGGWQVQAAPGRRFYGVGGEAVWAVPV